VSEISLKESFTDNKKGKNHQTMKKLLLCVATQTVAFGSFLCFTGCSTPPHQPPNAPETKSILLQIAAPIDTTGVLTLQEDRAKWHHDDIYSDPPGMHSNFTGDQKKTLINGVLFTPIWDGTPSQGATIDSFYFGPFWPKIPDTKLKVSLKSPDPGISVSSPAPGIVRVEYNLRNQPVKVKMCRDDVVVTWVQK
jgi:hypothetical protein